MTVRKTPKFDDRREPDDAAESREYSSPPCYQHEIDPDYQGPASEDWSAVRMWRKKQRIRLAQLRDSLDADCRDRLGSAIMDHLRSAFSFESEVVGFYWPLGSEIDLRPLMTELSKAGAVVALPAIVGKGEPLEFRRWKPGDALDSSGLWNIPTPSAHVLVMPTLLCVPLLGFDEDCHRLGYGGGFYDRTLSAPGFRPTTIGIAGEFGRLATIYPQEHDVPLHAIVTEREIKFRNGDKT